MSDIELPFRVGVVEIDNLQTVEPVLDNRAFTNDAPAVPLANRFGRVNRWLHAEVQRRGAGPWILTIGVNGIIKNLVFVLSRPIIDTTVAAACNFPLEAKIEVVGHLRRRVNEAATFALASDHSILDDPVPCMLPTCEVSTVEQSSEASPNAPRK